MTTLDLKQVPVYEIPLTQIAVKDRARKDYGDVDLLAEDIASKGQLTAGVVRYATVEDQPDIDPLVTPYVLVAGGRRYAACFKAGMEFFKAELKDDLPPLQQRVIELHENLFRKDLEPAEEVFLKEEIHTLLSNLAAEEGKAWTLEDTAREIGETKANISKDLSLAREMRANPALQAHTSKAAAIRAVQYDKAIQERIARVNQTGLLRVKERLHTADMRDFVRTLPTHSVDLCFTDFPFGIDYSWEPGERNKYADSQGRLKDLLTDVVPQILRVTKPTGWLALMMGSTNYEFLRVLIQNCCATHYEYRDDNTTNQCNAVRLPGGPGSDINLLAPCEWLTPEDPEWIWYRPNSRNPSMYPEFHAQNQYEKFCIVNMGKAVLIQRPVGNVLVHDQVYSDRIHEMQRPHSLCLDVVNRLTVGGELVLDLCFGSGSALAAAAELQRNFLGCDINPDNLEPALAWVSEHLNLPVSSNGG